jgi:hypothetical protein
MTISSSDPAPPLSATPSGAEEEGSAHLARDESLAIISPLILQLSVRISRRAALLEASSSGPAQSSDDLVALAWIQQSLGDVEATIIGLSEVNRLRSRASAVSKVRITPGE